MKGLTLIVKSVSVVALALFISVGFLGVFTTNEAVAQVRPAIVKNVDEPGRTPYEVWAEFTKFSCSFNCSNFIVFGDVILFDLAPVPAGKRWVIQHVSGRIPTSAPGATVALQSQVIISLQFVKWGFYGPFFPATGGAGLSAFSADAFTTYGPGEVPHVNVFAPSASNYFSFITFSGYLIDAN